MLFTVDFLLILKLKCTMVLSKMGCLTLFFAACMPTFAWSQKNVSPFDIFKNAPWLKDADIAVGKTSEIYTFNIENTEGVSRVAATKSVDEWVYAAKPNLTFFNRIHINDEVSVEEAKLKIKGSNRLSKSDLITRDVQDDDIFYSDAKAVDYSLEFSNLNEINHLYTSKVRAICPWFSSRRSIRLRKKKSFLTCQLG
jgi:hypothetical protein